MKDLIVKLISSSYGIVIIAVIIGVISVYMLGNDNPVEEISEKIIKEETGIEIDLTPSTPEKQKEDLSFLTKHRFSR